MSGRHFRLIIVPQSPAKEISQLKCPYRLLHVLIASAIVIISAAAGLIYHFVRHYDDMRQQTANLPQLRRQVLRQQELITLSEEMMGGIRTHLVQLQRAQAHLPRPGIPLHELGPLPGMGGEEYSETQNGEFQNSDFENDAGEFFSVLQENIQQQQRRIQDLEEHFDHQAQRIASTPSLWPVPGATGISSKYGMRTHPVTGQRAMHWGIDIGAAKGAPIVSTADGMVIFSGEKSTFGKVVVIDHGFGYTTFYGHCSSLEKQRGERVKRGDTIARVGRSGRTTSTHLHYEVRVDGAALDPLEFIAGY